MAGSLVFFPGQAFGQAEYDEAVGRPVDILISKHGAPSAIHKVGSSHKTYEYSGQGCTLFFSVHASGLIVDGKSVGTNCPKGYPDMESMRIASAPGWTRYDGPNGMRLVGLRVASRLLVEDYDGVDRLFIELNNPKLRLNDGRMMVTGLSYFIIEARSLMTNDMIRERLAAWSSRNPNSPAAAMTESMYWRRLAWKARGGGFAASVTKEGWELFYERMAKAATALMRVPDADAHPVWYSEFLEIAQDTGWPKEKILELFERAKRAHPGYHPYYFQVIGALTPRWGGSIQLIDAFIARETRSLPEDDAIELYTRMYWVLQQDEGTNFDIFRDSAANWTKMKRGFALLRERNSHSFWTMNNYAVFACRAHDKQTYQAIRAFLGYPMHGAWPSNLSLEVCDRRLLGAA